MISCWCTSSSLNCMVWRTQLRSSSHGLLVLLVGDTVCSDVTLKNVVLAVIIHSIWRHHRWSLVGRIWYPDFAFSVVTIIMGVWFRWRTCSDPAWWKSSLLGGHCDSQAVTFPSSFKSTSSDPCGSSVDLWECELITGGISTAVGPSLFQSRVPQWWRSHHAVQMGWCCSPS